MSLTVGEIWDYTNFLVRKEREGNVVTPEQFNLLLRVINMYIFEEMYKDYEENQQTTDSLKRHERETLLTIVNGESIDFPTDYYHLSSLMTNDVKYIDVVTDLEWAQILDDSVVGPTAKHPRAKLKMEEGSGSVAGTQYANQIIVRPANLDNLRLTYHKYPTTPVFDYAIDDSTDQLIYMEPNWSIDSGGALKNEFGGTVAASVTHPDNPPLPYSSESQELDYEQQDINTKIVNLVHQKIALSLNSSLNLNYTAQKEVQLNEEE